MFFSTGGFWSRGFLTNADLYDPTLGTWTATNGMAFARNGQTATLLRNGNVIIIGGNGDFFPSQAEVYNPATGTWRTTDGSLNDSRTDHTATLLNDGSVLVAGGLATSFTIPLRRTIRSGFGPFSRNGFNEDRP